MDMLARGMQSQKIVVLPTLKIEDSLHVVIVTSRADGEWILPKGNFETDLTNDEVAALEAWEEAGLRGLVKRSSETQIDLEIRKEPTRLTCLRMRVDEIADSWPEDHQRERRIVRVRKAHDLLRKSGFSKILDEMLPEV